MSDQRTHYVTTSDGVTIGGSVHGQGPPLVFLQGAIGDGDLDWGRVVGHLSGRFTCHLPSLRGRGLSGDHPDLSTPRQVEDLLTYVDSLGEPTGLVGWSGGGYHALAVAAQSDTVTAVAPFEPGILSLADEQDQSGHRERRRPDGRAGRRREPDGCGPRLRWFSLQRRGARRGRGRRLLRGRRALRPEPAQPPPASDGVSRPRRRLRPCSARSPLRWWCCSGRTPSPSSPPARGTWSTTSPTHECTRSPVPGTPPP